MGKTLNESGLGREVIFVILDDEVSPTLLGNLLYNPAPVMDGWKEEDIKRLETKYLVRKPDHRWAYYSDNFLLKQHLKHIRDDLKGLLPSWESAHSK